MLEMMRAANLLELKQYREARRIYVLLLGRLAKYTELRTTLLNNIAYTDILIADPNLLWEADACSREAFSQTPGSFMSKGPEGAFSWNSVTTTRGSSFSRTRSGITQKSMARR